MNPLEERDGPLRDLMGVPDFLRLWLVGAFANAMRWLELLASGVFAYEVTDLVTARARVEEAEQRLRLAVEAGNIGTWEYDPRTRAVRCDPKYRMFFGLSAAEEDCGRGESNPQYQPVRLIPSPPAG